MNTVAVADTWFQLTLQTYPPETARFLKRQGDSFANPVGHTLRKGMTGIVEALAHGGEPEELFPPLADIIRMRAVQEAPPSQSLRFIPLLKVAAAKAAGDSLPDGFNSRVDDLALFAFDLYLECRERIYEIRALEARNRTYRLLQRAGFMAEESADTVAASSCGPSCSSCAGCETED